MIIYHKILNISPEIEIIKKNQIKILQLKGTVTEMKTSLEWFNNRFEVAGKTKSMNLKKINRDYAV